MVVNGSMIGLPVPTCRLVVTMELLVFYPSDTRPKKRHFDGPVSLGVQQAVGENPELVPGFTSISLRRGDPSVCRLL